MKKTLFVALFLCVPPAFAKFTVASKAIPGKSKIKMEQVFNGFGCTGQNVSPDLEWKGAPKETRAFAVTMYDPDAQAGNGWWHWLVFNIPASVTKLEAGAGDVKAGKLDPAAIQSRTDFNSYGYGGPCPPAGHKPHRYFIRVYALKEPLALDKDSPAATVGFNVNANKLAVAELLGTFGR
ncbi:MAG: YbhB/YbcL family Raf kinase inhibitor-like protein [Deltaproteobacteria bacterium]|nr:YbhB/YbcL family Raf kinase inhibitor-like protein [Deltaproteobacteria bacterium]